MSFERPADRSGESGVEAEKNAERLKDSLKEVASDLREDGFPVDDSCRVDMKAFLGASPESDSRIRMHMQTIEGRQLKFQERQSRADFGRMDRRIAGRSTEPSADRESRSGEQLEGLKTVIFHKFLKGDFFTMRTSLHDDFKNGIDNLIIEKETGSVVGAFDEVVDISSGERFQAKQQKIIDKNISGGGIVRYGFELVEAVGERKFIPAKDAQTNIPIFYLALSKNDLEEGLKESASGSEKSEFEERIFSHFLGSIESQIDVLRGRESELQPDLLESLDLFADKLLTSEKERVDEER